MAEQLLDGRYRLLRPLGTGGMASVYLAEDLRLVRRVAVKILHPQFAADPTFVARFEGEARMAAALSHPAIVQVYDVGHDDDRYYIVMEYVEGETLKDLITRVGALPIPQALAIISGVLTALDVAHAHHLIHRDIKSQNILMTTSGEVKVTDFGIARELSGGAAPTLTVAGMVIGTVQYFAPEQAQGQPAILQSDLYAAGIVLFEMVTGRLPFDAENPLAVAMQHINQAPPQPTRLNAAVPPGVEAIILRALAKDPAARYPTAQAMKEAIEAARRSAAEPTRLSTRVAPAALGATVVAAPPLPGGPRPAPRSIPQLATAPPARPVDRSRRGGLWIAGVVLLVMLAVLAGVYANGGFNGGGGEATPTSTALASPTATALVNTATPHVVVPPVAATLTVAAPTATLSPTPSAIATSTPAATDTLSPPITTPTLPNTTATRAVPATDTPVPSTATLVPTATDTPAPPTTTPRPATATAVPLTATPTAAAPTATPTQIVAPTITTAPNSAPTILFTQPGGASGSHTSFTAGDTVQVNGSGWPDGATVTLTADLGTSGGQQTLATATVAGNTFTTHFDLPGDIGAGVFIVDASDDQGDNATQTLLVTTSAALTTDFNAQQSNQGHHHHVKPPRSND